MTAEFVVGSTIDEACAAAARFTVERLREALAARAIATLALTGGSTPKRMHELLARDHARDVDWGRVHFFFGDERCVPLDSPDSNYRMARETLLEPLGIAADHAHPMPSTAPDRDRAAREHEAELRSFARGGTTFDLVHLGMGEDGHVASLFPGESALAERERWVRFVLTRAKPPPERMTMTLPVFERADSIAFIVAGAAKARAVRRVLEPQDAIDRALPAARAAGRERVAWFLDRAASAQLARAR